MMGNQLIWILLLSTFLKISYSYDCTTEVRCKVSTVRRLKTVDCYNKNFKSFPKCIPSNAEVVELSFNRIRKVTKSDLSRFGYLTILYLTDNLLSNLDDETFRDLDSLTILDLSLNAITKVPPSLFQLPSLNKLYLSQNLNINIIDAVEEAKPITSPLTLLDISFTTDEDNIQDFPDFGAMPMLLTLNITGNQYMTLAPKHFAGLCNLQILINDNVTTDYNELCDCWTINNWLTERNVRFTPFRCSVEEITCLDVDMNKDDKINYNQCLEIYGQVIMWNRIWKIGIGVGIGVTILIILACVYFFKIRKNKRRTNKGEKQKKESTPTPADGMLLLNNQTKTFPI